MKELLHPVCAAIATLAFLLKARDWQRRRRDLSLALLCGLFAASAMSFILSLDPVWIRVDAFIGIANISALSAQICVMLVIATEQVLLSLWLRTPGARKRRIRRQLAFYSTVIAALIALFFLMTPAQSAPRDFTLRYASDPYYAAYLSLYIAVYAYGQFTVGRACWYYGKRSEDHLLSSGLRIVAVGAWLTLGYSAIRTADIIYAQAGASFRSGESTAWFCGDMGAFLTILGWTLPIWGARVVSMWKWFSFLRIYHDMYPMWSSLIRVDPSIVLHPQHRFLAKFALWRVRDVRLHRRVVEIRDAQLALRTYADPCVSKLATQLVTSAEIPAEEGEAIVEAAWVRGALRGFDQRMQQALSKVPSSADNSPIAFLNTDGERDLWSEAVRLARTSRAFSCSPLVERVLKETATDAAEPGLIGTAKNTPVGKEDHEVLID